MKVYMILWQDGNGAWDIVKIFSTEEKAQEFLKGKPETYWCEEKDVE